MTMLLIFANPQKEPKKELFLSLSSIGTRQKLLETKLELIRINAWSGMTLNYPHEGSVVPKANAVVGGSIPGCESPPCLIGKLRRKRKIPHVCHKKEKEKEKDKGDAYGRSNSSRILRVVMTNLLQLADI